MTISARWRSGTARRWRPARPSSRSAPGPTASALVTAEAVRDAARRWLDKRRSVTGYLIKDTSARGETLVNVHASLRRTGTRALTALVAGVVLVRSPRRRRRP